MTVEMVDETRVVPVKKLSGLAAGVFVAAGKDFVTAPVEAIDLTKDGIPGDRHGGMLRPSDVRTPWHTRGEIIFNDRQISLVSVEDLQAIAANLGVPSVEATWLGANVLLSGIPNVSFLPRGTRLFFPSGATLLVTDQNAPCRFAGGAVAKHYPQEARLDFRFVDAAKRLRGIVGYVEKGGRIAGGDVVDVRIPEQWIWGA